jgi:GGDEF domain-containing protein
MSPWEAAGRMSATARLYDSIGLYVGEKYVAVFASAGDSVTHLFSERVLIVIESQLFTTNSGEPHISARFGTASSSGARIINLKVLPQIALDALYFAKLQGRNRSDRIVWPKPLLPNGMPSIDRALTRVGS